MYAQPTARKLAFLISAKSSCMLKSAQVGSSLGFSLSGGSFGQTVVASLAVGLSWASGTLATAGCPGSRRAATPFSMVPPVAWCCLWSRLTVQWFLYQVLRICQSAFFWKGLQFSSALLMTSSATEMKMRLRML